MEFGASFPEDVVYMGDAAKDTPHEYNQFVERARLWIESHQLILGEGAIQSMTFSEGPSAYQMRAPRLSGPDNIIERIIN
jgi:hypothetical protein